MKIKHILIVAILISSVLIISPCYAQSYPTLNGYVNDFANLLTPEEELSLSNHISAIEKNTSVEIAILTIENTNGEDKITYAARTGDKNGVGKSDTDNGVVILWSLSNIEGGAIATGRGIESTLTDSTVGNIGRTSRKYFNNKEYYNGFEFIISQIESKIVSTSQLSVNTTSENTDVSFTIISVVVLLVIIVGGVVIYSNVAQNRYLRSKYRKDTSINSNTHINDDYVFTSNRRKYKNNEDSDDDDYIPVVLTGAAIAASHHHDSDDDDDSYSSSSGGGGFGGFGGGSFGGGGSGF